MADHAQSPSEPSFRATKRRKIFRKRTDAEAAEHETTQDAPSATDGITNTLPKSQSPQSNLLAQRRPVARKYGIGFTSSSRAQPQDLEENEERAVIPIHPSREQNLVQTDRFIKPTGKVAVVDDRHMYGDPSLKNKLWDSANGVGWHL